MSRHPVVGALVAVLLLGTGCSTFTNGLDATGDKGYITADGRVSQVPVAERDDPVELAGEGLDGEALDVAEWRGTPVVVVVWGSWCPPCRAEVGDVLAAADELGADAEFVGINLRDASLAAPQAFVRANDVTYPSIFSPDGAAMLALRGTLTPNSIPSFVVLDRDGRPAASIIGRLPSRQTLVDVVGDVVAES